MGARVREYTVGGTLPWEPEMATVQPPAWPLVVGRDYMALKRKDWLPRTGPKAWLYPKGETR